MLAGLFLLVVVVAAIGFLIYRRYTSKSAFDRRPDRRRWLDPSGDLRLHEAEDAALRIRARTPRSTPARCGPRPRRRLEAVEGARRDVDEETRQRRNELREQRLEVERREQRLADREERLDADNRALEEKARHLDVVKAELKAQRRTLAERRGRPCSTPSSGSPA